MSIIKKFWCNDELEESYTKGISFVKLAIGNKGFFPIHEVFFCKDYYTCMRFSEEVEEMSEEQYGFTWDSCCSNFGNSLGETNYMFLYYRKYQSDVNNTPLNISNKAKNVQAFFDMFESEMEKSGKYKFPFRTEAQAMDEGVLIKYSYFWHTNHYYTSLFLALARNSLVYEKGEDLETFVFSSPYRYQNIDLQYRDNTLQRTYNLLKAFTEGKYQPEIDYESIKHVSFDDWHGSGWYHAPKKNEFPTSLQTIRELTQKYQVKKVCTKSEATSSTF